MNEKDSRIMAKTPGRLRFQACGRNWTLHRPADLESLWAAINEEEFGVDERLPYWVEIWPASLALAAWLTEQDIPGRGLCLDLGCGLGFTALAAAARGARVLAADYEKDALSYSLKNAAVNGIAAPLFFAMDWRAPAVKARSCARIWASDILYEKRFAAPVLNFLDHALCGDGLVWLADPSRNTFENFRALASGRNWALRLARESPTPPLPPLTVDVRVNIWELRRAGAA